MSFSSITLEYRSQEVKTLKYFLIYSLIGSLVLHIGVLSSLLAYLLRSTPQQIEDQPIEVVMIDFPIPELEKPPTPIPQPQRLPEPRQIITSNHTSPSPARNQTVTQSKPEITQQQPVVTLRQTPITPPPAKVESVKTPPFSPPTPTTIATTNTPKVSRQAAVSRLESVLSSQTSEATTATPPTQSIQKNPGVLTGTRDSRATQGNSDSVSTVESNQPSGTSSVSTANTGTSSNNKVSVQPTTPPANSRSERTNQRRNSRRSSSGRAACVRCNTNYPEFARRQGIEGRVEVAVDINAKGDVTNVRLLRSSGNRRLDEEIKKQASNWKLQPSEGGRQGISIATDFTLEGSQRHRQVQERKRKQETSGSRETSRQTESSGSSPTATTSTPTRSNPVRRVRRKPQTEQNTAAGSSSGQGTTRTRRNNVRDSLRNTRSQETSTNSVTPAGETSTNPPLTTNNTSSSQNQLREALRRSRPPAELTPPTSSPESE